MEPEWLSLKRGDVSTADAGALLSLTAADLNALLEAQPAAEQQVLNIMAKWLGAAADGKTWDNLYAALASYVGRARAHLVTWAIEPEQPDRLDELEKHAPPRVMMLLRTIVSLYSPELESAYDHSNRLPDDWRLISREVYYNQLAEQHYVKIRIEKYNGEHMTLEGTASSLLGLTTHMVRSMRMVATRDAFTEQSIEQFFGEAGQLWALLQPLGKDGSKGEGQGTP